MPARPSAEGWVSAGGPGPCSNIYSRQKSKPRKYEPCPRSQSRMISCRRMASFSTLKTTEPHRGDKTRKRRDWEQRWWRGGTIAGDEELLVLKERAGSRMEKKSSVKEMKDDRCRWLTKGSRNNYVEGEWLIRKRETHFEDIRGRGLGYIREEKLEKQVRQFDRNRRKCPGWMDMRKETSPRRREPKSPTVVTLNTPRVTERGQSSSFWMCSDALC